MYQQSKEIYEQVARKGSKSLYFSSSGAENETWVYAWFICPLFIVVLIEDEHTGHSSKKPMRNCTVIIKPWTGA